MNRGLLGAFMSNERILNAEGHVDRERQRDDIPRCALVASEVGRANEEIVGFAQYLESGEQVRGFQYPTVAFEQVSRQCLSSNQFLAISNV